MRVDEKLLVVHTYIDPFEIDVNVRRVKGLAVEAALLRIGNDFDSRVVW